MYLCILIASKPFVHLTAVLASWWNREEVAGKNLWTVENILTPNCFGLWEQYAQVNSC
jgi:hypothetical protein